MNAENDIYYNIADLGVRVTFATTNAGDRSLLHSYEPFLSSPTEIKDMLLHLRVDDDMPMIGEGDLKHVYDCETGNGITTVHAIAGGGYKYTINGIDDTTCCVMTTNGSFSECQCSLHGSLQNRMFGLNNAIMLAYAFAGCFKQTLLIHASVVRNGGYGYAFIAKSGTGKSTQTSSWLRHVPGSDLMNDDNPVVRIIDGKAYIYGSPWSGKTPCYRNIKAPLGAITQIVHDTHNHVERLSAVSAFAFMLPSCSTMIWDKGVYGHVCDLISNIIETVNMYSLYCLPDKEAAIVCHKTISI